MKYENLQLLTNESQPYMDRFRCDTLFVPETNALVLTMLIFFFFFGQTTRYALVDAEGKLVTSQEGVIRTNCIDCLDRTNVVQVRYHASHTQTHTHQTRTRATILAWTQLMW